MHRHRFYCSTHLFPGYGVQPNILKKGNKDSYFKRKTFCVEINVAHSNPILIIDTYNQLKPVKFPF